jgi:hypothetical protein
LTPLDITAEQFEVIARCARHFDLRYLPGEPGRAAVFKTDGAIRKMYDGNELIAQRRLVGEMAAKLAMWLSDDASLSLAARVFKLLESPAILAKVRRGHRALERRAKRRLERAEPQGPDFKGLHKRLAGPTKHSPNAGSEKRARQAWLFR